MGFLFCFEISYAQSPFVRKISIYEGAPSEVIFDLFISEKSGMMYLGTDKGLISYDGIHFKNIPIKGNLANSITSIQEDIDGVIWCRNFANQVFVLINGVLVESEMIRDILQKDKSNLVDFKISNNHLWFITEEKVYYINSKGQALMFYKFLKEDINNELTSLDYNPKINKLYVSTRSKIYSFVNNKLHEVKNTIGGRKIVTIYKDQLSYYFKTNDGETWIGNKKVLINENLHNVHFNKITSIDNQFWLCTNDGVFLYNDIENTFSNGFLKGKRVTNIVKDYENNYWISTLDEGLYIVPDISIKSLKFDFGKHNLPGFNFTNISEIYNGKRYYGTSNGLVLEVANNNEITFVYDTFSNNAIEYIGFINHRLITSYGYFNLGDKKLNHIPFYFTKDLTEDVNGNILVATNNQAVILSKDIEGSPNLDQSFSKYQKRFFEDSGTSYIVLRNKRTRTVYYDKIAKIYYVGYIDGLYCYDQFGNEKEIKLQDQSQIIASDIGKDSSGSIWIGAVQNGLIEIYNQKVRTVVNKSKQLSSNNCKKIKIDREGIWIVTDSGFDFYCLADKKVKNVGLNMCLKGMRLNDLSFNGSSIFLVSNKEILQVEKTVLKAKSKHRFEFLDVTVSGEKFQAKDDLKFDANDNNVNINFRTVHFKSLGNYHYVYRLLREGDSKDVKWSVQSATFNQLNYLALNPGKYTFEIKVKIDEVDSEVNSIQFEIKKPYYQRLWFIILLALILISLLYFVYRWAEVRTRKSQELKEQLAMSQLTALRSQMNPHFIFNVLNAVQGLIYSNQKTKATEYLGNFSDLMRKILEISDKKEVTIANEFETINLYISLEKSRFEDDFEYRLKFPTDIDLNNYVIPSMIIQPFVENAIKHGLMHKEGLKLLNIKVEMFEGIWCFTIDDNGIGRKASEIINLKVKKHISFATKAIDNRVKLINKTNKISIDIEVIDKRNDFGQPTGTKIKIYIPIIEA